MSELKGQEKGEPATIPEMRKKLLTMVEGMVTRPMMWASTAQELEMQVVLVFQLLLEIEGYKNASWTATKWYTDYMLKAGYKPIFRISDQLGGGLLGVADFLRKMAQEFKKELSNE